MMKSIFGMQININVFYKLIVSFWICVARHAQITQNKKLASLQYLQKNVGDEVIFCQQTDTNVLYKLVVLLCVCVAQSTQNKQVCNIFCNFSRELWRMKWTFCLQISIKGFFKLILSFWVCVTRPRQITQNNKLFLCNILKKKWVIKLIFCM